MKEKSTIEKNAEQKQVALLSTALAEASNVGGHWLNASGKGYPRFYPKGVSVSAFNSLFMALHSDKNGCKTNLFTLFGDARYKVRQCANMNRVYRSCSIIGINTCIATIRSRLSAGMRI